MGTAQELHTDDTTHVTSEPWSALAWLEETQTPGTELHDAAFTQQSLAKLVGSLKGKIDRDDTAIAQLRRKIAFIGRVFSRNYNLDVLPAPQGGWAAGINPKSAREIEKYILGQVESIDDVPDEAFHPTQLFYDRDDLRYAPEQEILGVLRHEVGHLNHTDYALFFQGQRLAREEGYLPTSWANIHNALEDPWINNREIEDSEVVRQQMQRYYAARTPEILEKVNSQPVTRQLGLNIIYYWLHGENIPTLENQEVLKRFEAIRPAVDKYFGGTNAEENFRTLRDEIWPTYTELEQKATEDEALKELARQAGDSKLGQPSSGEGQCGQQQPGSQGEQEGEGEGGIKGAWNSLKKRLGIGNDNDSDEPADLSQIEDVADKDLKAALKEELEKQQREQGDKKKTDKDEPYLSPDVDLSKLPPGVLDKLQKLLDKLPPLLKAELEKQARKNLDAKNGEALKKDGQRTLQTKRDPETGELIVSFQEGPSDGDARRAKQEMQKAIAEQEEAQSLADAERLLEQQMQEAESRRIENQNLREREMQEYGFEDFEEALYDEFKALENPMSGQITTFIRIFKKYLPRAEELFYDGASYSGRKLNKRSVSRRAPTGDSRFYKRRETRLSEDPRLYVKLVIDNSGSMGGEKMQAALKTAVFWGRVLKKFEVPFSISFFGDRVVDLMKFEDDYDDAAKRIKPNLVKLSDASGRYTDMGTPLTQAREEMDKARREYPDCMGAVFVISDSGANRGIVGDPLKELIEEMQKDFTVMNFILTEYDEEVTSAKAYFGEDNVIAPRRFEDLPVEAFTVMRKTFTRLAKRIQRKR